MSVGVAFEGSAHHAGGVLFEKVALTMKPGQWTCLLGASGVGKTTILRMIAGLDTGAELDGRIAALDDQPLERRIAYMAQEDLLLPWATVRENVMLGARLRAERADTVRAERLLQDVGLGSHVDKKPHALSGGQRQRVALARTLMEDREIILLDEPFSALDARTRAEMQELAFGLLAGRTVLLVTHDPGEATRLGHAILILTQNGLTELPAPASAPPRAVDDIETLAAQAALLKRLRDAP
ncbi:ABC transporter ATP-binding protein [bacterium]|nr:ABC transporter ATP-binding protein [bacterium]